MGGTAKKHISREGRSEGKTTPQNNNSGEWTFPQVGEVDKNREAK